MMESAFKDVSTYNSDVEGKMETSLLLVNSKSLATHCMTTTNQVNKSQR